MKLVSCYIRAFGTMEDVTVSFKDGLNVFLCDNGVGKTTLSAFVRAMLYGLDYKQGRANFYERRQYLPWSEASCGGSLVIEIPEGTYRIERTFGKKGADDTFALYDEKTGFLSEDFDEGIGEKIFGVNKEGFEKSVYFGQGELTTAINDSLNAKIGNLADARDDINRFDEAIKIIDSAKKEYERTGKNPGKIPSINEKIKKCERDLEIIPATESAISERRQSIEEKGRRINELSRQREKLAEEIKSAAESIERAGKAKALSEQIQKASEDIKQGEEFFGDKLPSEEEIISLQDSQTRLVEKESRLSEIESRLPEEDRIDFLVSVFGVDEPATKELIDTSLEEAEEIGKLRIAGEHSSFTQENEKTLSESNDFFEKGAPQAEEVKGLIEKATGLAETEARIKVATERLNDLREIKKARDVSGGRFLIEGPFLGMLVGIFFLVGGLLTLLLTDPSVLAYVLSIGLMALGFISVVLSLVINLGASKRRKKDLSQILEREGEILAEIENASLSHGADREAIEQFINRFMDPVPEDVLGTLVEIQAKAEENRRLTSLYEAYKKDTAKNVDSLAELQMNLYTKLAPFGERYGFNLYEDHGEMELLSTMKEDIRVYDNYLGDINEIAKLKPDIDTLKSDLDDFLGRYKWDEMKSVEQKLLDIKGRADALNENKRRLGLMEEELKAYEDLKELLENEDTIEKRQSLSKELEEEQNALISEKAKEEEDLSSMRNSIEELEESARGLDALKESREAMLKKVDIYSQTRTYLTKARDEFLSVYMRPMKEGMDHYLEKLIPEGVFGDISVSLDMNLSINLTYRGGTYVEDHLSQGYKDLVDICARLALIDVLYKDTKPALFLDDPFANLDENKIQRALEMMEEISEQTQVIYMTCHSSRIKRGGTEPMSLRNQ